MEVGFTGTRNGMTNAQFNTVTRIVHGLAPDHVHHGDCVGADVDFHEICVRRERCPVILHPPVFERHRAWCQGYERECIPLPYMDRNQTIVDCSDALIATPSGFDEEVRSGTWSTVRKARKKGISIYIVFPDGSLTCLNPLRFPESARKLQKDKG